MNMGAETMMSSSEKREFVFNKAKQIKDEYYSKNDKNKFFKNTQKYNCAKNITENHSLEELMNCTIYNIPDTNVLFVDYNLFKLFIHPEIFDFVISYFFNVLKNIIEKQGNYELHIDLNSFTVSAANRYKYILDFYLNEATKPQSIFLTYMIKMNIYNIPNSFENYSMIFKNFANTPLTEKVYSYSKEESETFIKDLFK